MFQIEIPRSEALLLFGKRQVVASSQRTSFRTECSTLFTNMFHGLVGAAAHFCFQVREARSPRKVVSLAQALHSTGGGKLIEVKRSAGCYIYNILFHLAALHKGISGRIHACTIDLYPTAVLLHGSTDNGLCMALARYVTRMELSRRWHFSRAAEASAC